MIQYLKFRGDLSFGQSPFCDIDAMILSQLSSVDYTGLVPGAMSVSSLAPSNPKTCPTISQVAEWFDEDKPGYTETNPRVRELLSLAGASKRFGDIRMDGFVRDTSVDPVKQFSAITFIMDWRTRFVAFRGTDGYIVSWKENFMMNYLYPVPSQSDAVEYLRRMQPRLWGKLLPSFLGRMTVAGHSKGGNLALYAATNVEESVQKKLKKIYTFDSPGFKEDISQDMSFLRIKDLITGYIPKSSCVGRMLNVPYASTVIISDGMGVHQHSMFNWHVEGTRLETTESTDQFSEELTGLIRQWHDAIPEEALPGHIDDLFAIFDKNGITHSDQLKHMDGKQMVRIVLGARGMAAEDKQFFVSLIRLLWGEGRRARAGE